MPTAVLYYKNAAGSYGTQTVDYPAGGPVPQPPAGYTSVTKAEYDTGVAAIETALVQYTTDQRLTQTKAKKARNSAPDILVASQSASADTKAVASYVCDHIDDQVQINQAIADVLAAGGGRVVLSPGEFLLSDTINIPVTQVLTVTGSGRATRIKAGNAFNRYLFTFNGAADTRVEISDMTLDGNHTQQTSGGGIWGPAAVQCRFLNLHVTSFYQYGITLRPAATSEFGHTNYITNCLFDNSEWGPGEGTGLHFTSNDENFVTSCDFEFLGGASAVAAGIYDQSGAQNIINCNFTHGGVDKPTVALKDGPNSRLVGCNFDSTGGDGILVTGSGHSILGCTFFNVGSKGTKDASSGIHLNWAARNCVITGNSMGAAVATTEARANSLIREDGDGNAGNNLIAGNVLTGDTAFGRLTLGGLSSRVYGNVGASNGDENAPLKVLTAPVTDASFPSNRPPVDGTLVADTAGKLWLRTGGVWRSVALA